MTFLLGALLPAVVILTLAIAARIYCKIQSPSPLVFGCMIRKVCAVPQDEILGDIKSMDLSATPQRVRLRWAIRWKEFRLNWLYVCQEAINTTLFLRTLMFERLRIDPQKRGMQYDDPEVLIYELIDDAIELRWKQVRCQLALLLRLILGLAIAKDVFIELLEQYKEFEAEFVEFAGMENDYYQAMLIDKLGLRANWGVVDGGNAGPEPA